MNTNIGLKTLNAWRIKLNDIIYIITPAHNIIYKPDNINWKFTNFLSKSQQNE